MKNYQWGQATNFDKKKSALESSRLLLFVKICSLTPLVFLLLMSFVVAEVPSTSDTNRPADLWKLSLGNKPRPKNARTIIDAEDGAWFDDLSNTVEFTGKVIVHDPQFTMSCDKLRVVMNKNRQGLQQVLASGKVTIEQENINEQGAPVKSTAKAGEVLYEPLTGDMTLKKWPQVQQGINYQVATEEGTIMILNSKGTSRTIGGSRTMVMDSSGKEIVP